MPDAGLVLNSGSGGDVLDTWQDPNTSRKAQKSILSDYRGGTTFVASSGLITLTATASLRVWGIFNPAASGKVLFVHRIYGWATCIAAATSPAIVLQRTSDAVTTGTAVTAVKPDGSATASVVNVRNLPTTGTAVAGNFGSLLLPTTAGAVINGPIYDDNQMMYRDIQINAGTGLLLTAAGATPDADHRVQIDCIWEEV